MPPPLPPLAIFAMVANVYGCGIVIQAARADSRLLTQAPYSARRFYGLMGWAPLSFLVLSVTVTPRYLALFVTAGVLGIVGELIVSVAWRSFFEIPIWTYSYHAILRGYTSTINFLPWGIGALIFFEVAALVGRPEGALLPALRIAGAAVASGWLVAWCGYRLSVGRASTFSRRRFAWFCLPVLTTGASLGLLVNWRYVLLMAVFAPIGSLTEYAYGRGMSVFFQRGLWKYNHWKIDSGHTSFVTFPLWSLGGLYFYFIATLLGL